MRKQRHSHRRNKMTQTQTLAVATEKTPVYFKLKGIITNTSKKQNPNPKMRSENPRKSIYFTCDEQNTLIAKAHGLREYQSKEEGSEPFFIVQAGAIIKCYDGKDQIGEANGSAKEVEGVENSNFTSNDKVIGLGLMQGMSKGNLYYRLYAVEGVLVDNEPASPF